MLNSCKHNCNEIATAHERLLNAVTQCPETVDWSLVQTARPGRPYAKM